ncbi:MAG: Spx/MgsR family RNA polymerase-binding regulatory protein [Thermicanus sp.]|nr:Spx/MgsR family RNA polymerase-binding regulatory protein [Thermicanus sp.]
MLKAYLYPQCGTSRKGKKWLQDNGIPFEEIHIVNNPPSKEELRRYWKQSGLPLKKFFNTSGELYKALNLKEKLPHLSEEEQLELLSTQGKLLKRPIITDGEQVTVGFDEEVFQRTWHKEKKS